MRKAQSDYHRRNIEAGFCRNHKNSKPVNGGVLCQGCIDVARARLGCKKPYKPRIRIDWSKVDFSVSSTILAEKLGVSYGVVHKNKPKAPKKIYSEKALAAPTRQRRQQIYNIENGMCQFHSKVPIFTERSSTMCKPCYHKANNRYVKKKDRVS
jgi:hypothetical protein